MTPTPTVVSSSASVSLSSAATERAAPVAKEEPIDPRVDMLASMGFGSDKAVFAELLRRYGSVERVIEILVTH